MAHVELALSRVHPARRQAAGGPAAGSLERWASVVQTASEPCLAVDGDGVIQAVSEACCELLGFDDPGAVIGNSLSGGILRLLDFTSCGAELTPAELQKIPPLLAITSGRLARGLLRVQVPDDVVTLDAVATPLWDGQRVAGSLTFFALI